MSLVRTYQERRVLAIVAAQHPPNTDVLVLNCGHCIAQARGMARLYGDLGCIHCPGELVDERDLPADDDAGVA